MRVAITCTSYSGQGLQDAIVYASSPMALLIFDRDAPRPVMAHVPVSRHFPRGPLPLPLTLTLTYSKQRNFVAAERLPRAPAGSRSLLMNMLDTDYQQHPLRNAQTSIVTPVPGFWAMHDSHSITQQRTCRSSVTQRYANHSTEHHCQHHCQYHCQHRFTTSSIVCLNHTYLLRYIIDDSQGITLA